MIFQIDGEWLGDHISQFLQDPVMHVVQPLVLVPIQSHLVISNLIFSYGKDIARSNTAWSFRDVRDVDTLTARET